MTAKARLRSAFLGALLWRSKYLPSFLKQIPQDADLFDIGCGNDSPYAIKSARPDVHYVGLDVADYNQDHDPHSFADEYVVVAPEMFLDAIRRRENQFDAVLSNHNLEHCADPDGVVAALARALRPGGRLFMAFPSAASTTLPSREGTLNFFDDPTHTSQPPDFPHVLKLLKSEGMSIDYAAERYRPARWLLVGLLNEPRSRARNAVLYGTWALHGFENVIWATKK